MLNELNFMLTNDSIGIMIQKTNEFFEKPEAANARFHTALCTFGTGITLFFQSKNESKIMRIKKTKQ